MIYQTDLLTINDAISAIRQAFDSQGRRQTRQAGTVEEHYLKFEAIRFRFSNRFLESRRRGNENLALQLIDELRFGLRELLEDPEFFEFSTTLKMTRKVRARNNPYHPDLESVVELPHALSVTDFIDRLLRALDDGVEFSHAVELEVIDASKIRDDAIKLKAIVPEQKVSPVQFEIENYRLVVKDQQHSPSEGREGIAAAAIDELLRRGDDLASQLRNSNCDPRLLQNVEQLQEQLRTSDNVVQIGITTLACDHLAKSFSRELPDALAALLIAHTSSVVMYLSQFSEWRLFSDASEQTDASSIDVIALSRALADVANELKHKPSIASPEVPRTLEALRAFLEDPQKASKRATLSAARTLENFVIKVFGYGAEYLEKTAQKSVDGLSSATSRVVVAALLSAALLAATNMTALAPGIEGLGWMQDAVSIVSRQLGSLNSSAQ